MEFRFSGGVINDNMTRSFFTNNFLSREEVHMAKKKAPAKKTTKTTKKAAPAPKKYVCSTCGAVTTSKGHLCTPVVLDKAYKCEYCGIVVGNPRHVCQPKAVKLSYVCDACGRVAAKKTELCRPVKI
jgi:predicted RNA-binding Zn-ribbon protein involved in translation (DUF1610 family)